MGGDSQETQGGDGKRSRVRGRGPAVLAAVASLMVLAVVAFSGLSNEGGNDSSPFAGMMDGGGGGGRTSMALSDGGTSQGRSLRLKPSSSSSSSEEPYVLPEGIGSNTTFLMGIFSTRTDKEAKRRQLIRDTYLTHGRDSRVCYLSLYMQLPSEDRTKCNVVYTFVVGGRDDADAPTEHVDDNERLTLERAKVVGVNDEEDVTYLNIRENMEDGKSDTWLKYGAHLSSKFGFDYVGKTDSDTYVNVDELIEFVVTELPQSPDNVHIYGGIPWANFHKSSLYMAGQFYFVSSDLAQYVGYELTPTHRSNLRNEWRHTEDMDIGNFISNSPYPIKYVICSSHMFWHHPVKTDEEWMEFSTKHSKIGRPAWRNPVMPWRGLAKIWNKQGLIPKD